LFNSSNALSSATAFDSTGRHYDQTGNYTDWWDDATVSAFKSRAQCFIDQYSNFTVPNPSDPSKPLHVNGRFTLGENIADAGGLRAAFAAWKNREADNPSALLPGLQGFSKEKLFFMSYAGWWCGKTRPEAAAQRVFQDPHAPKWARIRGTMDNSPEFKEAFNCPKKEAQCELW
jgi:endothelin-converting enzyme